jgi:hypothetical protein
LDCKSRVERSPAEARVSEPEELAKKPPPAPPIPESNHPETGASMRPRPVEPLLARGRGSRRVHFLCCERVAAKPLVELVDAAREAGNVVIGTEPLKARLANAQPRGSGSAWNSSTSSGTIVAGSSRAA